MLLRKSAVARNPEQCDVSVGIAKAAAFCSDTAAQSVNAAFNSSQKGISNEACNTFSVELLSCKLLQAALSVAWQELLQKAAAVAVPAVAIESLVDLQADFSSSLATCIMSGVCTCTGSRNCQDCVFGS